MKKITKITAYILITILILEINLNFGNYIPFAEANQSYDEQLIQMFKEKLINSSIDQNDIDEFNNNMNHNIPQGNIANTASLNRYVPPPAQDFSSKRAISNVKDRLVLNVDNAPFDSYLNSEENVSTLTGGLNYQKDILNISGRGGLDLNLKLNYSTDAAKATYNDFYSLGATINYNYITETTNDDLGAGSFSTSFDKNPSNDMRYFGMGWNLSLPYFTPIRSYPSSTSTTELYFQFENGSKYKVGESYSLVDYKLEDVKITGNETEYIVTYKNGTVEKFDKYAGYIKSRTDKFGNAITFTYKSLSEYAGNPSFTAYFGGNNAKLLDSITGSFGTVNLIYTFSEFTNYNDENKKYISKIEFNFDNKTLCTLNMTECDFSVNSTLKFIDDSIIYDGYNCFIEYEPYDYSFSGNYTNLTSISDAEGQITSFDYNKNFTSTTLCNDKIGYTSLVDISNNYLHSNMSKITYATGGYTQYQYKTQVYYAKGEKHYNFKVANKKTYEAGAATPLYKNIYSYVGDYSGAPFYVYDNDEQEIYDYYYEPFEDPYKFYTIVEKCADDVTQGTKTIYTFDKKRKNIEIDVLSGEKTNNTDEDGFVVSKYPYHITDYIMPSVESIDAGDYYSLVVDNKCYIFDNDGNVMTQDLHTNEIESYNNYGAYNITNYGQIGSDIYLFGNRFAYKITAPGLSAISLASNNYNILPGTLSYKNNKFYFRTQSSIVYYDVETNTWGQACAIPDNLDLVYCGIGDDKIFYTSGTSIYQFDILTNSFSLISGASAPVDYVGSFVNDDLIGFYTSDSFIMYSLEDYDEMEFEFEGIYPDLDLSNAIVSIINDVVCVFVKEGNKLNMYYVYYNFEYYACGIVYFCENLIDCGDNFYLYLSSQNTICIANESYRRSSTANSGVYFNFTCFNLESRKNHINTKYTYDTRDLISGETIKVMDDSFERTIDYSYTYDKYGNLLYQIVPVYGMIAYGYSTPENEESGVGYHLLTSVSQYAGTENMLTTTFDLTPSKKNIACQRVTYDGILYKTDYTYDTTYESNLTSATLYAGPSNDLDKISEIEYSYSSSDNYTSPSSITNKNVANTGTDFLPTTNNITSSYTYYKNGLTASETDALGRTTAYEYYKNNLPKKITNPDGTYSMYSYLIKNIDTSITRTYGIFPGNVNSTTVSYFDEDGQFIKSETSTYDTLGRNVSVSDSNGTTTSQTASYEYSKAGSLKKVTDANNNSTSYEYDYFGRTIKIIQPNVVNNISASGDTESLEAVSTIEYNDEGLYSILTDSMGRQKYEYYDAVGRLKRESVQTSVDPAIYTEYTYDIFDNLIKEVSGQGTDKHTTTYSYDRQGRLLEATDAMGFKTKYGYDYYGNVNYMETAGGSKTYTESNELGWILWKTQPMSSDSSVNSLTANDKIFYSYNAAGDLVKSKDKKQQVTDITYKPNTSLIQSKTADTLSVSYTYDDMGNVLTMTDSTGTTSYTYDYRSRLLTKTTPDNKTIAYEYDNGNNVISVEDYFGSEINYVYNSHNKMQQIKRNNNVLVDYAYNPDDSLKEKRITDNAKMTYEYDGYGRLLKLNNYVTSTPFAVNENTPCHGFEYTYDVFNNVKSERETYTANSQTTRNLLTRYNYDANNRLTREIYSTGFSNDYEYDANGNRSIKDMNYRASTQVKVPGTSITLTGVTDHTITYTYNAANMLTGETESISTADAEYEITRDYTYDANGNRISKETQLQNNADEELYTYDALNRMISYQSPENTVTNYTYNGANERISKTTGTSVLKYYLNGSNVINETLNGDLFATNLIGSEIEGRMLGGNGLVAYIKNGHGDVRVAYDSTSLTATYDYDAFGKDRGATNHPNSPIRYSSEYYDDESDLIYLRNRYYDPSTGRFITEDPIRDGLNWYVYANNNPVMFVDPSGLIREPGYNKYGKWSQDPDADNYGKDSAKYKMLVILGEAWEAADEDDRDMITAVASNLRGYDDSSIEKVYYLNDSDGAGSSGIGFGHAAILLVNADDSGLLFSYFPQNTDDLFNSPSEIRIGVYYDSGTISFLNGWNGDTVSTSGHTQVESYDRHIVYSVSNDNGMKMMEKAVNIASTLPNYHLLSNNCDHIAVSILSAGGIDIEKQLTPNGTYNKNK